MPGEYNKRKINMLTEYREEGRTGCEGSCNRTKNNLGVFKQSSCTVRCRLDRSCVRAEKVQDEDRTRQKSVCEVIAIIS
jgi:hypothetical protein